MSDALFAEEQAALRRVAAVVAAGARSEDVFAAVTREVGRALGLPYVDMLRYEPDGTATVIGAWGGRAHPFEVGSRWALDGPTITARVRETGEAVRIDDYAGIPGMFADTVRGSGIRAAAGAPIVVDGTLWGVMVTADDRGPLPQRIEQRLAGFTELVAAALSQTQAREALRQLAEEQSALRRVATLVAQGAPPEELFHAVAAEVRRLVGTEMVMLSRYDHDGTATVVAAVGEHPLQVGVRWTFDGPSTMRTAIETGRSARSDDGARGAEGSLAEVTRRLGVETRVSAPIIIDGRVWGVMGTGSGGGRVLPAETDKRLEQFTELVATAISNAQASEERGRLADEQAALRRVATLVAHGAAPEGVFSAVAREVAELLGLPLVEMVRYTRNDTATVVGATGDHPFQPGTTWALDGANLTAMVRRTGRPARLDDYTDVSGAVGAAAREGGVHAGVGAPIFVDGELWGALAAGGGEGVKLAPNAESRLEQFTELVATALSNTQARDDLRRLLEEQAALRRIATLVARGAEPTVVFEAVCRETGRLLGATTVNLCRFTADGVNVTMAGWSVRGIHVPTGTRLALQGETINTLVLRTAAPGRVDSYEGAQGELASRLRELGIRSEVGAPVMVEGQAWGVLIAGTDARDPLPPDTEQRLAGFAELVATAIANATVQTELVESRARIVRSADEQRRRVVRDLHDGAQQRLVQAIMTLQRAQRASPEDVERLVGEALEQARLATSELRELAHGIHPAVLTHRGLRAAVETLADRAPLPVDVAIDDARLPTSVESAAYFITAEALTNVAKYAHATTARIEVTQRDGRIVLCVSDDGVGGAAPYPGSGLAGLGDRVAAVAGTLVIDSAPGAGTLIRAEFPLRPADKEDVPASAT